MAETFKNQVDALTGFGSTDDDALSDWLTAGAREIFNVLPLKLKEYCMTATELDNSPTTLTDLDTQGEIISVTRLDADSSGTYQDCRKIPTWAHGRASDSSDLMYYGTTSDPVYYVYDNALYVVPTPTSAQKARVHRFQSPSVAHGDAIVNNFPDEYEHLVTLYAARRAILRLLNNKSSNLPSDLSVPAMVQVSSSLPTYTAPDSFVLIPPPSGADIDFSGISSLSFPTIPVKPVMSEKSVTITGTAPTYTMPISAPNFTDIDNWITTQEDNEMAAVRIQAVGTEIQEYQSNIQNQLNLFQKETTEYQALLQKDIQDAQLKESKEARDLQNYQAEVQSYSAEVNKEIQRYQAEIQKSIQTYQSETGYDLNKYQAEISSQVQKFTQDLQKNTSSFTNDLQKYQAEVQKASADNQTALGRFGQELADYNARIQKESVDYQWLTGQYGIIVADYQQGIQLLIGGGKPMAPPQQGGQ